MPRRRNRVNRADPVEDVGTQPRLTVGDRSDEVLRQQRQIFHGWRDRGLVAQILEQGIPLRITRRRRQSGTDEHRGVSCGRDSAVTFHQFLLADRHETRPYRRGCGPLS